MDDSLFLGLAGLAILFGSIGVRSIERDIEREIAQRLGGNGVVVSARMRPAGISGQIASLTVSSRHFSVQQMPFLAEPNLAGTKRIHELRLSMTDFELRGLEVKEFSAKIRDVRIKPGHPAKLGSCGIGSGKVVLTTSALADYLQKKHPEMQQIHVSSEGERITISATIPSSWAKRTTVTGRLTSPDGVRIDLVDVKLFADGQPMSDALAKTLVTTLNPAIDLDRDLGLMGAMRIKEIRVTGERITGSGDATIPMRQP